MLDAGVRGDFTPGLILCRFFGCQEFSSRVLTMPNTRCAKRRRGVLDNRAAELKAEGLTPRDHRKYLTQVTQDRSCQSRYRLGQTRARTMTGVQKQQLWCSMFSVAKTKNT